MTLINLLQVSGIGQGDGKVSEKRAERSCAPLPQPNLPAAQFTVRGALCSR